jgi:hypothetical protein
VADDEGGEEQGQQLNIIMPQTIKRLETEPLRVDGTTSTTARVASPDARRVLAAVLARAVKKA